MAFSMWADKIVFLNGWFIYMDHGRNSIISHKCARGLEYNYNAYQAMMDIQRGGMDYDAAYAQRFPKRNGVYNYEVDSMIVGKMAEIGPCFIIPEAVGNIAINYIASEAFQGNTTIKKVIIHNGIQGIGRAAFQGCSNLEEVSMPSSSIEIEADAFDGTPLAKQSIKWPTMQWPSGRN